MPPVIEKKNIIFLVFGIHRFVSCGESTVGFLFVLTG
jgi:hypothetical protein